jgi:hypothetical protein
MDENRLKTNLSYQFGLVHLEEDWIAPFLKAIEETTFEEARFQPAPGVASAWEIVLHATGWMEDLLHDLTGSPNAGVTDWPAVQDDTQAAWRETQQRARALVVLMRDQLEQHCDDGLLTAVDDSGAAKARRIAGILVHNSYHAGQIIKLRQVFHAQQPAHAVN